MSRLTICVLVFTAIFFSSLCAADEEPSCGPNTYVGCKTDYCGQECNADELLPARVRCPHACLPGGCRCIEGYCYDTNAKQCVAIDDNTEN